MGKSRESDPVTRLVIRSLPACSITKFKSLTDNNSNSEISNFQIQIRSASVDFIHFAFGIEGIVIHKAGSPQSIKL